MRSFTEMKYWTKRWFSQRGNSLVWPLLTTYVQKQAMLKASRHIKNDEVVPEVPFLTIFGRVIEEKKK